MRREYKYRRSNYVNPNIKKSNKLLYILIILSVLLLISGIAYYIYNTPIQIEKNNLVEKKYISALDEYDDKTNFTYYIEQYGKYYQITGNNDIHTKIEINRSYYEDKTT